MIKKRSKSNYKFLYQKSDLCAIDKLLLTKTTARAVEKPAQQYNLIRLIDFNFESNHFEWIFMQSSRIGWLFLQ